MSLSTFCIQRPVFSTVLSLILIVMGIMGFLYLDTNYFPKFSRETINVRTAFPNASASLVESQVTAPLEEALSGIEGIDTMESLSASGQSTIKLILADKSVLQEVANTVRDIVSQSRARLPSAASTPIVRVGWNEMELMDIGFTSQQHDIYLLRDYLDRYVVDRLKQIPGIAHVEIIGAPTPAIRIALDSEKMFARGLTIEDVQNAIQSNNIQLPAGEIKGKTLNYPLTVETQLNSVEDFRELVVKNFNGVLVRIKDIAEVAMTFDNTAQQNRVTIDGSPGVLLDINTASNANPIDASRKVHALLKTVQQQLPNGIKIVPSFDLSFFMNESVKEVYSSILVGVFCVVCVIFLFLGQWRAVLIPITTIPVCLIASFGLIYLLGFSINVITLLAVVLSIGLVVDDAIVVLENIFRYFESRTEALAASIKGSREITSAVISMTLTLAAVYAPIGLVHGQSAAIFRSFAFTLAGAVLISGFVALTLSPMMCSRLLKHQSQKTSYSMGLEHFYTRLQQNYQRILSFCLGHSKIVVGVLIGIAGCTFFMIKNLPQVFMPPEDMGFLISSVSTPNGTNVDVIQEQLKKIIGIVDKNPEIASSISISDENAQSFNALFSLLVPHKQRERSSSEVADSINKSIRDIPGLNAYAFSPSFGGSMKHYLQFTLMGSGTYQEMNDVANRVIEKLKPYPGLLNLQNHLVFDSQQYRITVNRELASQLNINIEKLDTTVAALLGGINVATINRDGKSYNVYLKAPENDLHNLSDLNKFYVKSMTNQLIPIANLIQVTPVLSQPMLTHFDRLRSAEITGQLASGYDLGTAVKYLQQTLPTLLPDHVKYAFLGKAKELLEANSSMLTLFVLALLFIYLVLSAQFESFIDPLIVLLAVPLSIIGALLLLKCFQGTLNVYTEIALITLIGLIAKHGIMITQFANQLQKQGLQMPHALIKAAATRLRPILMTTSAMIFGTLPLLFSTGGSAESRHQMGIALMGGLFFGTFFSLIIVPLAYFYANLLKLRLARPSKSL